jgi:HK97 family phage major capsid protein
MSKAWLAGKVADKFARFENAEFVTGAANKIRGFISGYTDGGGFSGSGVTWGKSAMSATGNSADFAANPGDKIYDSSGC